MKRLLFLPVIGILLLSACAIPAPESPPVRIPTRVPPPKTVTVTSVPPPVTVTVTTPVPPPPPAPTVTVTVTPPPTLKSIPTYEPRTPSPTFSLFDYRTDLIPLSYIQVEGWPYTDDADPKPDGISFSVNYYDNKSNRIYFKGVPVEISLRLWWTMDVPSFYIRTVKTDTSGDFLKGEFLRIPFNELEVRPAGYTGPLHFRVAVTDPDKREFVDEGTVSSLWLP